MSRDFVWRRPRVLGSSPHGAGGARASAGASSDHEFNRTIWLPVPPEPVTLTGPAGMRLPGRILDRRATSLTIAIVVPLATLSAGQLEGLVVEYANPCGCVRFTGNMTASDGPDCVRVEVEAPQLVTVVQQRAYFRVDVARPVEVDTPAGSLHTHTVDLSGGGMLLAEGGALARNETVPFILNAFADAHPIVGTARTVRFDAEARPALEFVSISVADRWRLVRFTLDIQRGDELAPMRTAAPAAP